MLLSGNMLPRANNFGLIGTDAERWAQVHTNILYVGGSEVNKIQTSSDTPADDDTSLITEKYFNLHNVTGAATWGAITGTLSDQSDLQGALNNKFSLTTNNSDNITEGAANLFLTIAERAVLSSTSGINTGEVDEDGEPIMENINFFADATDDI